jgi:hypothetical protein
MAPNYLATFRRAVREAEGCEKSELSEKRGVLNSLNSLNSHFRASGKPFGRVFEALEARCPDHIETGRWHQAVEDGKRFLPQWGEQAKALGWTARDLFSLAPVPDKPHPSYWRLSRYDETGLIWLLQGRQVVALTEATAAIQNPTGAITTYRRFNRPALGPVGDSLDDLDPPFGGERRMIVDKQSSQ